MEVVLKIPDDILEYIEYIPREVLPDILVDAIRRGIVNREIPRVEEISSNSVDTLLEQILNKLSISSPAIKVDEESVEPEIIKAISVSTISGSEDDLDDFMDLLK